MTQPIVTENFAVDSGQLVVSAQGPTSEGSLVYGAGATPPGTCNITNGSGGGRTGTLAIDTNQPVVNVLANGPAIFVVMEFYGVPVPSPGSYSNFCVGIGKDGNNNMTLECGSSGNATNMGSDILTFVGGGQNNLEGSSPPLPFPDAIGFQLVGNRCFGAFRYSGVWSVIHDVDLTPQYDFTAPGALTDYYACFAGTSDNGFSGTATSLTSGPPILAALPNVVGDLLSTAETTISSAGFVVGTATYVDDPSPVNTVIAQVPGAGYGLIGATVDLTVSNGGTTTTVPNIVNTSITVVAPGILAAAGLVVGAVSFQPSGTVIPGNVISQAPAAGATVLEGSGVNAVVSSGLPTLTVPDLFGLTQADAVALLLSLGLTVGAVGSAPSQFVPVGEVQQQNPTAGAPCATGTVVSFVISLGQPASSTMFDFEATVISQYANSPTIMQLCQNLNQYIDQSANFANFYNYVWNVDSAVGFGLDIWGKIVNVSRLLVIPNSTIYAGFYQSSESQPDQDWTPAGSSQPPYNNPPVGGAMYTGYNATTAYLLPDDSYRQLILAKAFANICTTTAPAINQILQNLYGPGTAFVLQTGPMAISYNLTFKPTAIQLAILEQSGVIPTPPGVAVVINTDV